MKDKTVKQVLVGGEGWMKEIKVRVYDWWTSYTYMKQNKETSCNCFKWSWEGVGGRDDGGDLTNVQCKPNWNCHNESPLFNEYIQIKIFIIKKFILLTSLKCTTPWYFIYSEIYANHYHYLTQEHSYHLKRNLHPLTITISFPSQPLATTNLLHLFGLVYSAHVI
jgi:hypothetical protein